MGTPFKLKNGSVALLAEVPGGLYNSAHLKKLAALSEQHSVIIKATEDQRLALFVVPEQVEVITKELASGGLAVRDYQDGIHQPLACLGALCPESKQDALKSSLDITEALAGVEAGAALKIGINGCATCCVPCHTLDIAIVGTEEGYRISIGGKQAVIPELGSFAAEGIPADQIVEKVKAAVNVWKENGQAGERMQAVIERIGMEPFINVLAPYSADAGGDAKQVAEAAAVPGPADEVVMEEEIVGNTEPLPETTSEDALETTMVASMEAEAAFPVEADENASVRDEVLESLPEVIPESAPEELPTEENVVSIHGGIDAEPVRSVSSDVLEGMEIDPTGKFVFSFGGGASVSVDPMIIPFGGSRTLKFAGKELTVRADGNGFNVDIDGLSFHMPLNAA